MLEQQIEKLKEVLLALDENFDIENEIADEYSFLSIVKQKLEAFVKNWSFKSSPLTIIKYGFKGIYTDMNAIRPDEMLDNIHSLYVDQWDWEHIISKEERNLEYLKNRKRYNWIKYIKKLGYVERRY